jgi:hypothetical protein
MSVSTKTFYVVQPFSKGKRGALKADLPIQVSSEGSAIRRAESLAETKVGVLAFSQSGDPEMGDFDEPVVLARHGEVPEM